MTSVAGQGDFEWRAGGERNGPVHDALLLVQVADPVGDLHDDMPREVFGKVGELDDLVEELAAFHEPALGTRSAVSDGK